MATKRTQLSKERTDMAIVRTLLSTTRTSLAKGRTYLAVARTGLAFLAVGIALFRLFGISWWTLFDISLAIFSLWMTFVGLKGYLFTTRQVNELESKISAHQVDY